MEKSGEYNGKVSIWKADRTNNKSNYLASEDVKVEAPSAENALRLIQQETYKRFPLSEHFVQVEQIKLEGKVVYHSLTDDTGALLAGAFSE